MSGFGTSQESMHAGAIAVREAQQAITEHIGTLRREVEQMMGGSRRDAGSAFTSIYNSFEDNADRIRSALARMHDALAGAHRTDEVHEPGQSRPSGT